MKKRKYEVGDQVVIMKNLHHHGFSIGQKVKIVGYDSDSSEYQAQDLKGLAIWWVIDEELL